MILMYIVLLILLSVIDQNIEPSTTILTIYWWLFLRSVNYSNFLKKI